MEPSSNAAVIEQTSPAEQPVNTGPGREMPSQETIRKYYLNHEASVKSIGTLYYIGAAFFMTVSIVGLALQNKEPLLDRVIGGAVFTGLGIFLFFVARGLRTLRPWSRVATFVIACIGLLGFPAGTVINGYILYLVASKKGVDVFSDDYQAVLMATPHIRYKTSILGWIIMIIGVLLVGLMIIAALTSI